MYGRCETDPFDQATDVCDSCYGEFCSACMVKTKSRKHPLCKECTIVVSGVRPGAKPLLRGSKKTAAERRKTLRDAPPVARTFEYFDDAEPTSAGEAPTPERAIAAKTAELAESADGLSPWPTDEPAANEEASADTDTDASEPEPDPDPEPMADWPVIESPTPDSEPERTPSTAANSPSTQAITPGLAALAQHQAERREPGPDIDPSDVPAPAWSAEPNSDADPFAEATAETGSATETGPRSVAPVRTPIDAGAKPVTDGFDWVTKMPPRGSSAAPPQTLPPQTNLPPQTLPPDRPDDGTADTSPAEGQPGTVATAERPAVPLPRRRSKLRPDDHPKA